MPQSIAIMILGSATGTGSAQNALEFAKAVLASGHRIERLFFYHDAVTLGSNLGICNQDETDLPSAWQDFVRENRLDAVVCIASAIKRGVIDTTESKRYGKTSHNLDSHMALSGLGQWVDAVNKADKYIVFGA